MTRVSAPAAKGSRTAWQRVPQPVREAIEQVCGAPVIEARDQPGGFSPGMAARVRCADGSAWFVKAASGEVNPDTPVLHRQEANVLAGLEGLRADGGLPVPRLRGTAEYGPWFALIAEYVAGQQPALPWRDAELSAVLTALPVLVAEVRQRAARRRVVGGQIGGRARATSRAGLGVPESGHVLVGAEFAGRR
jgi:hypothetical protein